MKSIKLASAALLTMTAFSALAPLAVSADETYDSTGSITYTPSTDPTDPVNPTDPTQPTSPQNPDGTLPNPGTAGPLSIDFASSFDFGTQKITSSDMSYTAAAQKFADGTTGPNYVQVTDNRGTLSGWSLSVTQNAQFSTGGTGTGSTLDGAQMMLTKAKIVSASATPADISQGSTILTPGTQSGIILGATNGNGAGTNLLDFGDASTADTAVVLGVPGATTKLSQAYTTDLTWTLSDTPA
jgi:hypothetical protein